MPSSMRRQSISLSVTYRRLILLLGLILQQFSSNSQSITLRRSFVDSFKSKVTINSSYDVWYTHHTAKAEIEDGDIHCSGYDKKIGMPTVAEIMNAKNEQDAIDVLISHEGMGKANNAQIEITGVWRLWPEHMGGHSFFQGMKLSKAVIQQKGKKTNPDHVFEIHPITSLENSDLLHTLRNIGPDYVPYDSRLAFSKYRKKGCTISSTKKSISFVTSQIGYNYIDLWIRIDSIWEVDDGAFAYCTVLDSDYQDGNNIKKKTVSTKTRIVFVKDSETYNEAINNGVGGFMHILGTPRVNLAILSWREWISKKRPEVLTWKLPFEIIADGLIH